MHLKSNNMQLVNTSEQNFLTTDGKFDNLASFLPASILDVIISHCKGGKPPNKGTSGKDRAKIVSA